MKKLLMAISLVLTAVLLLSSLPLGVLADAETVIEMKAVNFDANSADVSSGAPLKNTQYRAENDNMPLITELSSDRFLLEWENELSEDEYYDDAANAQKVIYGAFWLGRLGTTSTTARLSYVPNVFDITENGIMFYVKLDAESPATTIYFETTTAKFEKNENDEYDKIYVNDEGNAETKTIPFVDSDAAFLPRGTTEWIVDTADHKLGKGPRGSSAAVEIPAGFEGFVYLPNNTIADYSRLGDGHIFAFRFNIYVGHMTNEYDVEFSNFMVAPPTIEEVTSAEGFKANGVTYKYAEQLRFNAKALTVLGAEQSHDGFYTVDSNTGALAESYNKADANYTANIGADAEKELLAPSLIKATPNITTTINQPTGAHLVDAKQYSATGRNLYTVSGTGEGVTLGATSDTYYAFRYLPATYDKNYSALFYLERQGGTEPIKLSCMYGWHGIKTNMPYYLYDVNTKQWTKQTAEQDSSINNIRSGEGYMTIPVGFKGWVLYPYNSSARTDATNEFRYGFYALGGEKYGDVILGDLNMLEDLDPIEDAASLAKSVFVSSSSTPLSSAFPFNTAAARTEVTSNGWYDSAGVPSKDDTVTTTLDTTTGLVTITASAARPFRVNSSNVITSNGSASAQRYQFTNGTNPGLTATGAVIFYIKNDTAGDYVAIMGENCHNMYTDMPYYLLGKDSLEWVEYRSSSADYSLSQRTHGTVTIPAGFEGWVSLPLTSLYDNYSTINTYRHEAPGNLRYFTVLTGAIEKGSVYISKISASTTVTPSHFTVNGEYKGANEIIPDVTEKVTATVKNENGTFINANDVVCSTLHVEQNISVGGGLMFWVETEKAVSFKISVGDMATAKKYGKDRAWTAAYENGCITLPAGFSGWVKVAVPEGAVGDKLRFTFKNLSNGFKVSDFMGLNTAADLDTISLANGREKPIVYKVGDFSLDNNVDILDLVVAKVNENATSLYSFARFEGEGTQSALLRAFLLK